MDEPERNLDRVLDLLWGKADSGNVVAMKALYEHYRRDEEPEQQQDDGWAAIYGENVTPIGRRAS
jgi:hypothetical protein